VLDPAVLEDPLHFLEAIFFEDMFEIGMPDAKALEARSGSRFYTIFEIE
jgi:hypothetical protein